jgi:mono/diheme cytochrome c family protein
MSNSQERKYNSKEIMKIKMKTLPLVCLVSVIAGLACAADVQENWTKNCASCHGKDGKGETKAGKKAEVKDLTDATYQASFTDEQMIKQIKEGMKDKNGKEKMKPFGDKLNEEEIKALVAHVRSFKK